MENEKKATAIVKKIAKKKNELIFAGAGQLMKKPTSQADVQERQLIVLVSKALKISPMGINILGNLPYVNNQGRKEKLEQYKPGAQFRYEWVHIAVDDLEKAICKAKVIDGKGKELCDFVIGECSPASMKMGTLKGYQNHMAQTRAENRAFEAAFGAKFRTDLYSGIDRELNAGKIDADLAQKALNAGKTSAEEAVEIKPRPATLTPYQLAIKAIEQQSSKGMLELLKGRMKSSKNLSETEYNFLCQTIDEKIATLKK